MHSLARSTRSARPRSSRSPHHDALGDARASWSDQLDRRRLRVQPLPDDSELAARERARGRDRRRSRRCSPSCSASRSTPRARPTASSTRRSAAAAGVGYDRTFTLVREREGWPIARAPAAVPRRGAGRRARRGRVDGPRAARGGARPRRDGEGAGRRTTPRARSPTQRGCGVLVSLGGDVAVAGEARRAAGPCHRRRPARAARRGRSRRRRSRRAVSRPRARPCGAGATDAGDATTSSIRAPAARRHAAGEPSPSPPRPASTPTSQHRGDRPRRRGAAAGSTQRQLPARLVARGRRGRGGRRLARRGGGMTVARRRGQRQDVLVPHARHRRRRAAPADRVGRARRARRPSRWRTPRWPRFVAQDCTATSRCSRSSSSSCTSSRRSRTATRRSASRRRRPVRLALPAGLARARRDRVRPAAGARRHEPAARAARLPGSGGTCTGSRTRRGRLRSCTRSAPAATPARAGCRARRIASSARRRAGRARPRRAHARTARRRCALAQRRGARRAARRSSSGTESGPAQPAGRDVRARPRRCSRAAQRPRARHESWPRTAVARHVVLRSLAGRSPRRRGEDGLVNVVITERGSTAALAERVRIDLRGVPDGGGGVSMTASGVSFVPAGTGRVYTGSVDGLDGTQVVADVVASAASVCGCSFDLSIDARRTWSPARSRAARRAANERRRARTARRSRPPARPAARRRPRPTAARALDEHLAPLRAAPRSRAAS